VDDKGEYRFFNYFISKNSKGSHIGWDVPWIYKLILNKKRTIVPEVNLIKNIGYNFSPEGQGAKKFRKLKISKIDISNHRFKKINLNLDYDIFLRKSFYHRNNIFLLIKNKLLKIFKTYFCHS